MVKYMIIVAGVILGFILMNLLWSDTGGMRIRTHERSRCRGSYYQGARGFSHIILIIFIVVAVAFFGITVLCGGSIF